MQWWHWWNDVVVVFVVVSSLLLLLLPDRYILNAFLDGRLTWLAPSKVFASHANANSSKRTCTPSSPSLGMVWYSILHLIADLSYHIQSCFISNSSKWNYPRTRIHTYMHACIHTYIHTRVLAHSHHCNSGEFPFAVHNVMFLPTILNQTTPEQKAKWLPLAESYAIIGTYAQVWVMSFVFPHRPPSLCTLDWARARNERARDWGNSNIRPSQARIHPQFVGGFLCKHNLDSYALYVNCVTVFDQFM